MQESTVSYIAVSIGARPWSPSETDRRDKKQQYRGTTMRVLLVEDNAVIQEQVRQTLEAVPGAEVVQVVVSAQQARDWLAGHPDDWDLALVDLFLAKGHGFDVLRHCRQRKPHQRAVVLSNYTRDPVRAHAAEAGADAVFDKTFDMDALVAYCEEMSRGALAH
jgi:DNA-binding NarL/FixJ family response regulator